MNEKDTGKHVSTSTFADTILLLAGSSSSCLLTVINYSAFLISTILSPFLSFTVILTRDNEPLSASLLRPNIIFPISLKIGFVS